MCRCILRPEYVSGALARAYKKEKKRCMWVHLGDLPPPPPSGVLLGQRIGGGGGTEWKTCVVTSIASFLVLGGGGQDPQMYRQKIYIILRERAPQKHIFSALKIHLPTYTISAFSFTYGMAL